MKPLAIDLFCGLGGWTEGLLAEGYNVVGFDIEQHIYGDKRYPAQLVLQDVRTIDGAQFRNAALIVASPPCTEFSYRAMPWKLGRALSPAKVGLPTPAWWDKPEFDQKHPDRAMTAEDREEWKLWRELYPSPIPDRTLFDACFRIQREASAAAGRYIPMVVENVKGAQPWVGKAKAHYGSFYLWGDVEIVGRRIVAGGRLEFGAGVAAESARKIDGYSDPRRNGGKGAHLTSQCENDGRKVPGINLHDVGFNVAAAQRYREGVKQGGSGSAWFDTALDERRKEATAIKNGKDWFGAGKNCSLQRRSSSRSNSRKAASAMIAKIPFALASYIASAYNPKEISVEKESIAC